MDHLLGPLEGDRVRVVAVNKGVDRVPDLRGRREAGAPERAAAQDAKPTFDLIEPAGMRWREVEMDGRMPGEPAIVFGLVRVEVVQHHMELPAGMGGDHRVHEGEKLPPAPAVGVLGHRHLTGQHVERRKEGRGPVPFVLVADASNGGAVGEAQVPLSPLEGLDVRLLIDGEHHGVVGRVQIQADNVGGLGGKLRIGAQAPRPSALKLNPALPQDPPDVVLRHVPERLSNQRAGPRRVARRRGLIKLGEDTPLGRRRIVPTRRPGARPIGEPGQAPLRIAGAPFAHRRDADPVAGELVIMPSSVPGTAHGRTNPSILLEAYTSNKPAPQIHQTACDERGMAPVTVVVFFEVLRLATRSSPFQNSS